MPKPGEALGASDDELLEVFNRKIAAKSMLPTATAMKFIAEWEARVVEQGEARPTAANGTPHRPSITNLADLKRFFTTSEEE